MKVSASRLQVYIDYLNEVIDLDEAIKRLTQPVEPTEPMKIGTILHNFIENASPIDVARDDFIQLDNYKLVVNDCLKNVVNQLSFPFKVTEYKMVKEYPYKNDIITLSGVADILLGTSLIELKTTSHIDIERYYNSPQWRVYFDLFDADRIEYHILKIQNKDNIIEITEYAQLNMYDYIGRDKEVKNLIYEFYDFVKSLNIELHSHEQVI